MYSSNFQHFTNIFLTFSTMKKNIAVIEIDCCNDCRFVNKDYKQVGLSTHDDYVMYWYCTKLSKNVGITDTSKEKVEIPSNCPFLKSDEPLTN